MFQILQGHVAAVTSVAFDTDEYTLVVGGQSGHLKLWDLQYGQGAFGRIITIMQFHIFLCRK